MNTAIAIIPARGGSKRIPRKNIAPVNGHPLISYPIRAALESGLFKNVIVSTEDQEIKDIALSCGAEVSDRPDELATDTTFESEVYKYVLGELKEQPAFFCGLYATALFIEPSDLIESFRLLNVPPQADVVMSVCSYPIHPFKALKQSPEGYLEMVYPEQCLERTQTYPEYVASNGTFYWCRTAQYLEYPNYYPQKLKPYLVASTKGIDIDLPEDLEYARAIYKQRNDGAPDRA